MLPISFFGSIIVQKWFEICERHHEGVWKVAGAPLISIIPYLWHFSHLSPPLPKKNALNSPTVQEKILDKPIIIIS